MRVAEFLMKWREVGISAGRACFTQRENEIRQYSPTGEARTLHGNALAFDVQEDGIYVLTEKELLVFDTAGNRRHQFTMQTGRRAGRIIGVPSGFMVGYGDGRIEFHRKVGTEVHLATVMSDPPGNAIIQLVQATPGFVAAATLDGEIGIWNTSSGARIFRTRLHGLPLHLRVFNQRLYAATWLGDYMVRDLRVFGMPYCELMRQIWRKAPSVWKNGRAVPLPRPGNHRCASEK